MNGQKLIIQCAQLFGLFIAFVIGTLYKLTSFLDCFILFCSKGTNVFVIWLYKLDVPKFQKHLSTKLRNSNATLQG